MGKLVSWIAVVLLLFVVPLISWIYLRKGLEYRKTLIKEVTVKDSVNLAVDSLRVFKGKTTLVVLNEGTSNTAVIDGILEQYKEVPRFQILSSGSDIDGKVIPQGYFSGMQTKYTGKNFVLVDTSGLIRNTYTDGVEDVKKLVEHIAVVLPRKEESDIKMKK